MPPQVDDDELAQYAVKPHTAAADDEDELAKYAKPEAAASPEDELGEYLKHGGISGETGPPQHEVDILPGATPRLRATAKKLTPPTRTEKETPEIPPGYGFGDPESPWFGLKFPFVMGGKVVKGLGNVAKFGKELATDISDPNKPLLWGSSETEGPEESTFHKYAIRPQEAEAERAKEYEEQSRQKQAAGEPGSMMDAIIGTGHRIASVTPFVGPWMAGKSEQAGTGDVGGALGETIGEMAGGKAAEHGIAHPIRTVKFGGRVVGKVALGTPITEAGRLAKAKEQAMIVKPPSMTETEYAQQVNDALPELQRIAQENKGKINDPRSAVGAMSRRIAQKENPIGQHLKNVPAQQQMVPAQNFVPRVEAAIDAAFNEDPGYYKDVREAAKKKVLDFIGDQDTTIHQLEGHRRALNEDAKYDAQVPNNRSVEAARIAADAGADAIRDVNYGDGQTPGELERVGIQVTDSQGNPVSIRDFRREVGRLITIRNHFRKAITLAERTGDWSAFDVARTGPSLAAGGAGLVIGGAAKGVMGGLLGLLGGEGLKAWQNYLNSKNRNLATQKMFKYLADTSKPITSDVTATMPPPPVPPPPAVPFQHQVGAPQQPPPVPAAHAMQTPGTLGQVGGQLGLRGQGGVRIAGQLPAPVAQPRFVRTIPPMVGPLERGRMLPQEATAVPVPPETNLPPIVGEEFGREEVQPLPTAAERAPETQLGTVGRGGVVQRVAGELPKTTPFREIQDRIDKLVERKKDELRKPKPNRGTIATIDETIARLKQQVPGGFEEMPPQRQPTKVSGKTGVLGKIGQKIGSAAKKLKGEEGELDLGALGRIGEEAKKKEAAPGEVGEERRTTEGVSPTGTERRKSVYEMSRMSQPTEGERLGKEIRAAREGAPSGISEGEALQRIQRDPDKWEEYKQADAKQQGQMLVAAKREMEGGRGGVLSKIGELGKRLVKEEEGFITLRRRPLNITAKGEDGPIKIVDIGKAIGEFSKEKYGKVSDKEAVDRAIKMAAPEIKYQMATDNTGLGWYEADTQRGVDAMSELHPELTDPKKASLFKTFWSALSYGKNPYNNLKLAEEAYGLYKKNGTMPITHENGEPWGVYKAGHEGNMRTTQRLIDKFGEDGAVDWLLSKHPTSELREMKGGSVPGKAGDMQYGAVVYGPKGGNFFLNLNGVPDVVTVDKWMTRVWHRWSGQLTGKNVDAAPKAGEIRNAREAIARVADKLGLEPRDAQAVLWYYEQELYKAHGFKGTPGSYGSEAERIVSERKAGNVQPERGRSSGGGITPLRKVAKR